MVITVTEGCKYQLRKTQNLKTVDAFNQNIIPLVPKYMSQSTIAHVSIYNFDH